MIFRRALQREFAQTAAAVFVALFAILISTVLIRLLGQAAGGRVPPDAVVALIGFGALAQLPTVLTLTLFIAILVSLSRSYRDSEMVVWFASGVPLTAWIRPVLMFALPVVLVAGGGSLYLTPWSQQKSAEYRERLENRDDTHRVAPGVFRESASAQRVFFVEVGAGEDGRVRNVFVSEQTRSGQLVVIASAVTIDSMMSGQSHGTRGEMRSKAQRVVAATCWCSPRGPTSLTCSWTRRSPNSSSIRRATAMVGSSWRAWPTSRQNEASGYSSNSSRSSARVRPRDLRSSMFSRQSRGPSERQREGVSRISGCATIGHCGGRAASCSNTAC